MGAVIATIRGNQTGALWPNENSSSDAAIVQIVNDGDASRLCVRRRCVGNVGGHKRSLRAVSRKGNDKDAATGNDESDTNAKTRISGRGRNEIAAIDCECEIAEQTARLIN